MPFRRDRRIEVTMNLRLKIIPAALASCCIAVVASLFATRVTAQEPQQEPATTTIQDPISRLNLTPEQRQKIRAIRAENRDERAAILQRVKDSNEALEKTLDVDNPNEALVEQGLQELALAQAASNRMRVLTELRIRRVLTPEQTSLWRSFRAENIKRRQELQNQRNVEQNGDRVRPNQRNGLAPLLNRRVRPSKTPR